MDIRNEKSYQAQKWLHFTMCVICILVTITLMVFTSQLVDNYVCDSGHKTRDKQLKVISKINIF